MWSQCGRILRRTVREHLCGGHIERTAEAVGSSVRSLLSEVSVEVGGNADLGVTLRLGYQRQRYAIGEH